MEKIDPRVQIALGIALIGAAYLFFKDKDWSENETSNALGKEVDKKDLTFQDSHYLAMADQLFIAMEGAGTDPDSILEVLSSLETPSDWFLLVKEFGTKENTTLWWSERQNLIEFFGSELSNSDLNEYVKQPLREIGVNY